MQHIESIKTLLVLGLASLVLFTIFHFPWALWLSLGFLVLALLPGFFLSRWITRGWLGFAAVLGQINSRILLTLTFFLVLMPSALLRNLFQRETTRHFHRDDRVSTFYPVETPFDKESFENTW